MKRIYQKNLWKYVKGRFAKFGSNNREIVSTVITEEPVSKQYRLNCKCLCLATKGSTCTSRLCTYMIDI